MKECPFCHKKNLIDMGKSSQKSFRCEKTETTGTSYYSSTHQATWHIDLFVQKYACSDCGMVHERIDDRSLEDYLENKEHIVG